MKKLFLLLAAVCCTMGAMANLIDTDLPDSYNLDGSQIQLSVKVFRVMANGGVTVSNSYTWQTREANSITWTDVTENTFTRITTSGVTSTIKMLSSTALVGKKIRCIVTQDHSVNGITRDTSNVCTFVCNPVNVEVSHDEVLYTDDDMYACTSVNISVSFDSLYVGTPSIQWYSAVGGKIAGETNETFTQDFCEYIYDSIYALVTGSKGDISIKTPIVYISKSYGVKVLGEEVTSRNAADILGDGTIWLEDDTLYMKGLNYQTTNKDADTTLVESDGALAVRCIGANRAVLGFDGYGLLVHNTSRLSLTGDTLILQTGDGSGLTIHDDFSAGFGTIVVKDMQWLEVHHVGAGDGISGGFDDQDKFNDVLELDNCNIRVRAIDFFGNITMADNIEFKEPEGLYIGQYTNTYTRMSVLAADGTQQWGNYSEETGEIGYIVIGVINTALESIDTTDGAEKILRNGQMLILRDGRTYNVLGTELK